MYRLDVLTVIIAACTFRHTLRFCRLGELPQSGTPEKAQPSSWAFSFLQVAHCAAGRAAPLKGRTCTYPWPSPRAGLFHFRPAEGISRL